MVGTWVLKIGDYRDTFVFKDDGTWTMGSGGQGTWEIKNGKWQIAGGGIDGGRGWKFDLPLKKQMTFKEHNGNSCIFEKTDDKPK
jgi:hypothetical protein